MNLVVIVCRVEYHGDCGPRVGVAERELELVGGRGPTPGKSWAHDIEKNLNVALYTIYFDICE